MVVSRSIFFLTLFAIMVLPIIGYRVIWYIKAKKVTGNVEFIGHDNLGSVLGVTSYPVIIFFDGKDSVHFNNVINLPVAKGDHINILFNPGDPSDARVNDFKSVWGDTISYLLLPVLVFLGLLFHPEIVPYRSRVAIGGRPFINVVDRRIAQPKAG